MLDFGVLPPEINSGRMYAGPGAGPLLAAATAWGALAAELYSTAAGFGSVASELAAGWRGPASLSMSAAAARYAVWLHNTAMAAEQTAAQANAAAAAYELAFGMTVPPPVIAANRSLLMALIATNFFGQNTPAIAVTETHYAEMWVQDAAAMYGYAGSSAAASQLTPFTEPPRTTDPTGAAAQSGAVAQAAGSAVGTQAASLPQVAAPAASTASSMLVAIAEHVPNVTNAVLSSGNSVVSGRNIAITNARLADQEAGDLEQAGALSGVLVSTTPINVGGPAMSAAMGRATLVGSLTVPTSWATATPQIQSVAAISPQIETGTGAAGITGMPTSAGSVFSQALMGTLSRNGVDNPRPKTKPVIVRSPAAG